MKNLINENIELFIKILVLLSSVFVVTPLPFMNGSLYFWFVVGIVIIYNLFLIFKDFNSYLNQYKWEIIFIISCLISGLINYKYNNIYSIVYVIITAYLIFSMIPHRKENLDRLEHESKVIDGIIVMYTYILTIISFFILFKQNLNIVIILSERFGGYYINPNQAAFWCFISIVISCKYFKKYKIFIISNFILQSVFIFFTGCRSVYIAFIFYVFYIFIKKMKIINIKKLMVYLVLISITSISIISYGRYSWFVKYLNAGNIDYFLNIISGLRYFIWKDALKIFFANPFLGVGVNNLQSAAQELLGNDSYYVIGNWEDTHNIVITLLSYTGLVGFILFGKMIYNYIHIGIQNKIKYDVLVLILLLIIVFFDIGIIFDDRILSFTFWYFVGNMLNQVKLRRGSYEKDKIL